jgi:hypothetical protein
MQALDKFQKSLTPETVSQALYTAELKEQISALTLALQKECKSEADKAILENTIKQVNAAAKVATEARLSQTRKIDAFKTAFMDAEKQLLTPLNAELAIAKAKVDAYNKEQYRIAQEKQRKRDEELAAKTRRMSNPENIAKVEALAQAQKQTIAIPTGVKKVWVFEIDNPGNVPAEYMQVNEAKVKAAIAAGVRSIPGLIIKQDIQRTGR